MKKVLFVLGKYYPDISANGVCCDKIMRRLQNEGCEVFVAAAEQYKTKKVMDFDGILCYHYKTTVKNRITMAYHKSGGIKKAFLKLMAYFFNRYELLYMSYFYPIVSKRHCGRIYKKIKEIHALHNIDTIVAVSYPVDAVKAAVRFKKLHPEIFTVSYLLDPIVEGKKGPRLTPEKSFNKAIVVEREIVEQSDAVICQKEHEQHFEKYYKAYFNKVKFLGIPLLEEKPKSVNKNAVPTVVYAGSLFKDIRNPEYIFNVFKEIPEVNLCVYTPADMSWLKKLKAEAENIVLHSKVSHEEIEKVYLKADAFLNIGNSYASSAPSKIIEYMGYLKPVITTFRIDDDPSKTLVNNYPLGLSLDENDKDYSAAAHKITKLLNSKKEISYEEIKKDFYLETPEAFCDSINDFMKELN